MLSRFTRACFTSLLVALPLAVFGCSSDDTPASSELGPLDNGTQIHFRPGGGFELKQGDRVIFALADGAAPEARTFKEIKQELFAIWDFDKEEEVRTPFSTRQSAVLDAGRYVITYGDGNGNTAELIIASAGPERTSLTFKVPEGLTHSSLALPLSCADNASFYGFGAQYGQTDQRGQAFDLWVSEQGIGRDPEKMKIGINGGSHTTYFPMPYFIDGRGFGVLAQTERRVHVDLCKTNPDQAWMEVVDGKSSAEFSIFHGPTTKDVIRELGDVVGRPKAPPPWAYELWIGSQGGRDAVLAEVDALEKAQIPVGTFWVQDWSGIRMNLDGGFGVQYRWVEDAMLYPDLKGMVSMLKSKGYHFLAYANPFIDPKLDHYDEMAQKGFLIKNSKGEPYTHAAPNVSSSHPDFTNEAARDYVRGYLKRMSSDLGIDGWMNDFAEWLPLDAVYSNGTDPIAYHNHYPIEWHRIAREAMDETRPDGDWVLFGRSGFTGVHKYSQIHWVGDQEADFSPHDGLPTVVPAMINLGLSGVPFITHDIAGFSGGPSTKELFLRWTELGAFTPIMRTHEGNNKLNNWSWEKDAETTAHFRRFARIHQVLIPEIKAAADEAAKSGLPIVRHLILEFPDDAGSKGISNQYMLGDKLLVAPVVNENQTEMDVYLPPGKWFNVWTGEELAGGQTVKVQAPIGSPPVFSKDADRADLRAIQ